MVHCLPQLCCSQLVHNPAGGCNGALLATTVVHNCVHSWYTILQVGVMVHCLPQLCCSQLVHNPAGGCYGALFATTVLFAAGTQSCRWCYGALFATTVLFTAGTQSCRWLLWCIVCHNCAVHSWYTILQVAVMVHCLPQLCCSQLAHNPAGGCYGALFATTVLFAAGTQSCRWCYGALLATTVLFAAGTQSCRWCYGALFATTVLFAAGTQSCRWL